MLFEPLCQGLQFPVGMIVTDCPTGGFPDMFLGVQLWRGRWEADQLQAWVGVEDLLNLRTPMPRRTVPQEQDRDVGVRGQDRTQVGCGGSGMHRCRFGHKLVSRLQVQRPIEVGLRPARITANDEWVSTRTPDRHGGRLQVQRRFVFRQNDRFGCSLGHVDQFFSSCVSNSNTARSLRDLNTLVGRW